MILAFDTYYFDDKAKTVCIAFANWTDVSISQMFTETIDNAEKYTPGEFYKRELPGILSLLKSIKIPGIECIIIDGFVFLDDAGKQGFGGRLYDALNRIIPIVGIAKTNFATLHQNKRLLLRGKSKRPLYITAAGMDIDRAAQRVSMMAGESRIPTLLKYLDILSRAK